MIKFLFGVAQVLAVFMLVRHVQTTPAIIVVQQNTVTGAIVDVHSYNVSCIDINRQTRTISPNLGDSFCLQKYKLMENMVQEQ